MLETIWKIISKYPMLLLEGTGYTVLISLLALVMGVILGTGLALMRLSKPWPVRAVARVYIEAIRGTPLLLQLFIFAFGLPSAFKLVLPNIVSVILALGLNSAAYVAEIIRSGIQAVDRGQSEAARSLGMSSALTMRRIVLPQAVKNILPALGNEFVMMVKESSLAATLFVGELMSQRQTITNITYKVMEPLIVCAIIYFVLTFTLGKLIARFERRLSAGD